MSKIAILGSGGWGTALAVQLSEKHSVTLWSAFEEEKRQIEQNHENKTYLPGIILPEAIKFTSDRETAVIGSEILIIAVPSKYFKTIIKETSKYISPNQDILIASKGFEPVSGKRLSVIAREIFGKNFIGVLSGPSHAEEVARNIPTLITIAGRNKKKLIYLQHQLNTKVLRLYRTTDIKGVEVGGACKNVIAVASGICRGLNLGDNTTAALITRGLAEIKRLGLALGAKNETFSGLSGVGDLIVTCTSEHSRNYRVGYRLGKNEKIDDIIKSMKMVAEGVDNVETIFHLSLEHKISMPITQAVYNIIKNGTEPDQELKLLLERSLKEEFWL